MKIDVAVLTKNSGQTLERCLTSIYKNIPVNRLIVADGHSIDNTMEILAKFKKKYGNVLSIYDNGTRATARQKAIENIETEWFMFVDSDAILCDNWFNKAKNFMKKDVGAIWGIEIWSVIKNPQVMDIFKKITMKIFEIRGGTHDLLVRYDAVKDIQIPPNLHSFEDAYIKEWIIKRGFKVVAAYQPYCLHLRLPHIWTVETGINTALNEIRCGLFSKYRELLPSYFFYVSYSIYQIFNHLIKSRKKLKSVPFLPTRAASSSL
jgi:glycosyltransferase involved in cell wall biosynthesis